MVFALELKGISLWGYLIPYGWKDKIDGFYAKQIKNLSEHATLE